MQLFSLSLPSFSSTLLVDHQSEPTSTYSGLFIASIPENPFIDEDSYPFHFFYIHFFNVVEK